MKRLRVLLFCLALCVHGYLDAQQPAQPSGPKKEAKPLLFGSLPESFEVNRSELQKIFALNVNDEVRVQLSNELVIEGKVVDKNQHNPGSISLNIRVSNFSNALFNVTLRLSADNSTAIQGRILHPRYGDVLQIFKENEKYYIKKNSQALYMPE